MHTSGRKYERLEINHAASWDFFNGRDGLKAGIISNISQGGCLLKTDEPANHRRWIKLVLNTPGSPIGYTAVGRVLHTMEAMEIFDDGHTTLYRHGVEFTHPTHLSYEDLDLIFALSKRNWKIRSCLIRNIRSVSDTFESLA